jgi:hypothetical protein
VGAACGQMACLTLCTQFDDWAVVGGIIKKCACLLGPESGNLTQEMSNLGRHADCQGRGWNEAVDAMCSLVQSGEKDHC